MIRGQIIITLSDGNVISYANKFLAKKAGVDEDGNPITDNAGTKEVTDKFGNPVLNEDGEPEVRDISTPLFDGYPEYNYYYTGNGDDKFEDQTGAGKIKNDYEFLASQLGVVGNDILRFPETDDGAVEYTGGVATGGTTELIRKVTSTVNGVPSYSRKQVSMKEVLSITIKEDWVTFPYGRESGYQLSKESDNFMGFHEYEDRKKRHMRGPDFNKHIKYDNGYIPNPILELEGDELIVVNEDEFDEVKISKKKSGYEVYGTLNGKNSGVSFIAINE